MRANVSGASLILCLLASAGALLPVSQSTSAPRREEKAQRSQPRRAESTERKAETFSIVIKKSERKLYLYGSGQRLLKTYRIALGNNPQGHNQRQGDGARPEGAYYITHKNPRSNYYLSLGLSYPNRADADAGLKRGLITPAQHQAIARAIQAGGKPPQNTRLGGDIFIHGGGVQGDWTLGCIALENENIKELFDQLPVNTPVQILP
jgi:murein L,D-transpeptidase YafK